MKSCIIRLWPFQQADKEPTGQNSLSWLVGNPAIYPSAHVSPLCPGYCKRCYCMPWWIWDALFKDIGNYSWCNIIWKRQDIEVYVWGNHNLVKKNFFKWSRYDQGEKNQATHENGNTVILGALRATTLVSQWQVHRGSLEGSVDLFVLFSGARACFLLIFQRTLKNLSPAPSFLWTIESKN